MSSKHKKDFLKLYGLNDNTVLTIEEISIYTGIHTEHLYIVFNRGEVIDKPIPKAFSFHKIINKKPKGKGMERVYEFCMKGKTFKEADKDIANYYGI
jgi:hypothetical protein